MLAGIAAYVKRVRPGVLVIGVEAEDAAGMTESLRRGERATLEGRLKVAPALFEDSAPSAAMASPEAESRPPQPQAAAQQLGRRRSLPEGVSRGVSKRGLAILNQQERARRSTHGVGGDGVGVRPARGADAAGRGAGGRR